MNAAEPPQGANSAPAGGSAAREPDGPPRGRTPERGARRSFDPPQAWGDHTSLVQVVAHRGSSARNADNTWAAFEAAVTEGADAIECDVQATRDGVLVVRHDLAIDDRLVADMRVAEIEARAPETVALAALLEFAERAPIDLLIEMKDPDAADALARLVTDHAGRDRIVVGSFHGPALATVKASVPDVRTSFMISSVAGTEELIRLTAAFRADGVHLCWEKRAARPHKLLNHAAIGRLRGAGLAITLWHEEREDELSAMVALEPDAICTNTPAVLRRIVDAHRRNFEPSNAWPRRHDP